MASPSPLPSASLTRQWSSSCWNAALRPSPRREGIMLCFSMSQFMLVFMVPSMNCSSPVPVALMQPQTMTIPPHCLTVGKTHLSFYSSPRYRHTRLTPSEPNKFILVIRPTADHLKPHQPRLRPVTRTAAATIGLHNQRISAQTVRNSLREAHLHARHPHRGLDLTAFRCRNRLEWANAHIRWHLAL